MKTNTNRRTVNLQTDVVGYMPVKSQLRVTLLLTQSHKAGRHSGRKIRECFLCKKGDK